MKILFKCLLILMVCGRLEAGELYAFLVGDTCGENIEGAVALDLSSMEEEVERVAWYTGLNLVMMTYPGDVLSPDFLKAEIEGLSFNEDDVVIFYYSGHGYRTMRSGDYPWPNMYFSIVDRGMDFYFVSSLLAEKSPGLLLSLCDCCNNWMSDAYAPPVTRKGLPMEEQVENNYRTLFLGHKGVIRVCSSEPGEYSWCTSLGSFYTVAFLEALKDGTRKESAVSWELIFEESANKVRRYQTPVYEIETKKAPV